MVLSAVVTTLALALVQADEPTPAEAQWSEPTPVEPRRTKRLNEDLRNGVIFSAERLFPLVTVQGPAPPAVTSFGECPVTVGPSGCPSSPDANATRDAVQVGPTWDAARSLFDFPALAFDGAVSGVTLGGSVVVGQTVGSRRTSASGGVLEATYGALGISPRIGYAAALGDTFAIWPRLGVALAVTDTLKDDFNLLFVTTQLGALWFFTRHAALSLTPAYHAPMTNERTNVSRFAVDLGLTIAF